MAPGPEREPFQLSPPPSTGHWPFVLGGEKDQKRSAAVQKIHRQERQRRQRWTKVTSRQGRNLKSCEQRFQCFERAHIGTHFSFRLVGHWFSCFKALVTLFKHRCPYSTISDDHSQKWTLASNNLQPPVFQLNKMRWRRNFGTKLLMSVNHREWGRRLIAWAQGHSRGAKKARFLVSAERSHDNGTIMLMMMFAMTAWDLVMEKGRSWRISWVGYLEVPKNRISKLLKSSTISKSHERTHGLQYGTCSVLARLIW